MPISCPKCDGSGLLVTVDDRGNRFAHECPCRVGQRIERTLNLARVPPRYLDCSLDGFDYGGHASLGHAFAKCYKFANLFPYETKGVGLMLTGAPGNGKTHLAVSILKQVIATRGAVGYFWEHKELLEKLRSFYDVRTAGGEETLLRTVITCDLLVLDDLGDISVSDWSWDTTAYILNSRYNENRSTIITTNRPNEPARATRIGEESSQLAERRIEYKRETLGDRIGDRMWSRLQEMCVTLHLQGSDFRRHAKRATFA